MTSIWCHHPSHEVDCNYTKCFLHWQPELRENTTSNGTYLVIPSFRTVKMAGANSSSIDDAT